MASLYLPSFPGPRGSGCTGKERTPHYLPSAPVLGPLRAAGWPLLPRSHAGAMLTPVGLPSHLLSEQKGSRCPRGSCEQTGAQGPSHKASDTKVKQGKTISEMCQMPVPALPKDR